MVTWRLWFLLVGATLAFGMDAHAQEQAGSIRGVVYDKDFDAPLPGAQVQIVDTGETVTTSDEGTYVFPQVAPGTYTLSLSKPGYLRVLRAGVVVSPGQLTDVDASLAGDFTEMDEFVVQDIQLGAGSEAALLALRFDSPAIMDSISSDLMSRAGASDAAGALRLVSGATVQDGKFAVIRGLPDRYVSSQLNGVRLPSADEDTRAVELDQYPSAVIESVQVSKTFTPDQQGDASGGAVNVKTKNIPDEPVLDFQSKYSVNTNVADAGDDFLTYKGGGVNRWGHRTGTDPQPVGESWSGAVGVTEGDEPIDYKLSGSAGGKAELENDWIVGGFATAFYERDSSYYDDGIVDSKWVTTPGEKLVPETTQGAPDGADPETGDFKTKLFDVTQGVQAVQWGGLGTVGLETSEEDKYGLTYQYTHTAEDKATLAEDTRGKEYFFPGYDVNDPFGPGNTPQTIDAAPYLRTETLEYTEQDTWTLQLDGEHTRPLNDFGFGDFVDFTSVDVDWNVSKSKATLDQPDKRQFGSQWTAPSFNPGTPPFDPPFLDPATHSTFKPAANVLFGNAQHIYKKIDEDSDQYSVDITVPFQQWDAHEGYVKVGSFADSVDRTFDQDTYSNFLDESSFDADFDVFWSDFFPQEDHPIEESLQDIDYDGHQSLRATYAMVDLPLTEELSLVGGARWESTGIEIEVDGEEDAKWYPPGALGEVDLIDGAADVDFEQNDVLPSIGLVYRPSDELTFRASYSQTVARQTFRELSPIIQQEFLGGPIFIGNPDLQMASIDNYDLRVDYVPYDGGLISVSWFDKDLDDPIEFVQRNTTLTYTTPVNYPDGEINGWEFEIRQDLGNFWQELEGLSIGGNATFISSEVSIPKDEQEQFKLPNIDAPQDSRDATGAPDRLFNIYLNYDLQRTGTQFALFYTVRGDTLIAGATASDGNYIPDVYEKEVGTLNFTASQKLGERATLKFEAKNLTNPDIKTVYRGDSVPGGDVTRTSYTRGREFALSLSVRF